MSTPSRRPCGSLFWMSISLRNPAGGLISGADGILTAVAAGRRGVASVISQAPGGAAHAHRSGCLRRGIEQPCGIYSMTAPCPSAINHPDEDRRYFRAGRATGGAVSRWRLQVRIGTGERRDHGNTAAARNVGDALWARPDHGSEPDALRSAHAEDALTETARGADDSQVMR
jgi:hypothetical protein